MVLNHAALMVPAVALGSAPLVLAEEARLALHTAIRIDEAVEAAMPVAAKPALQGRAVA